jgi:hypothetical protein
MSQRLQHILYYPFLDPFIVPLPFNQCFGVAVSLRTVDPDSRSIHFLSMMIRIQVLN